MSLNRRVPLSTLVERWSRVVAEVERGYTLTLDDYLNDLDLRHRIARRLSTMTGEPLEHTDLAAVDARFRAATAPSADCVWGAENASDEGWTAEREWYYFRQLVQRPPDW